MPDTGATFPRAVRVWASSQAHGSNLAALYSASWAPRPELSHADFRSVDDREVTHRAGVDWAQPVAVASVSIRWTAGYVPRAFRVTVRRGGESSVPGTPSHQPAAGTESRIPLAGEPIDGIVVEQAPGGGDVRHPGVMRIACLSIEVNGAPELEVGLLRPRGVTEWPTMPLASDGHRATSLDVSDANGLEVRLARRRQIDRLTLVFSRIGSVGSPRSVAAWLSGEHARVRVSEWVRDDWGPPRDVGIVVDGSRAGVVAGTTRVEMRLSDAVVSDRLRVELPPWPQAVLGLVDIGVGLGATTESGELEVHRRGESASGSETARVRAADTDVLGIVFREEGHFTLEHARTYTEPVRHAASLGIPGTDPRVGIAPDGGIQIHPGRLAPHAGSHAQCLHVGFGVGGSLLRVGEHPGAQTRRIHHADAQALTIETEWKGVSFEQELVCQRMDGSSGVVLLVQVTVQNRSDDESTLPLCVAMALRDFLWTLPLELRLSEECDGRRALRWPSGAIALEADAGWEARLPAEGLPTDALSSRVATDELRLIREVTLPPCGAFTFALRLPLTPCDRIEPALSLPDTLRTARVAVCERTREVLAGTCAFSFPDPGWDRLVRTLLAQAALFVTGEGRMPYGQFPSVYAGDVYGLEEDYTFFALACWGNTDLALRALRNTYLTDEHLSKRHYLHDLRNGLTPWQTERLLRLARRAARDVLSDDELARLRGLGDWTVRMRGRSAQPSDAAERPWRHLPGLLPAYRFGGDLDFPTQSLFTDVANCVGVRALARLLGGDEAVPLLAEARDYRRAILDALDAVRVPGVRPELDVYPLHTGGGDPGSYYQLVAAGILDPLDFFPPGDPRARAIDAYLERSGRLFFALPRFDDWGSEGFGIDAHYTVGFLLNALRAGRRELFWTGLLGLVAHAMDPEVHTFREVGPVQLRTRLPETHLPGRRLGRSEPCIGAVGVVLQLVRHALLCELPEADGTFGAAVRLLPGVLPSWWRSGSALHLSAAPTFGGPVSLHVEPMLEGAVRVEVEALEVSRLEVAPPALPDLELAGVEVESLGETTGGRSEALVDGVLHLPAGRHLITFRLAPSSRSAP